MIRPIVMAGLCSVGLCKNSSAYADERKVTAFEAATVQEVLDAFNAHNTTRVFVPADIAVRRMDGTFYIERGPNSLIAVLSQLFHLRACPNLPDIHSITLVKAACPRIESK